MAPLNIQTVLDAVLAHIQACRVGPGPGQYRRQSGIPGDTPDPLGTAAAAGILYSLGVFPGRENERNAWISTLSRFQQAESGLCRADGESDVCVTAAVAGALQLFEQRLEHPPHELLRWNTPATLGEYLAQLDWGRHPEAACRGAAALFAVLGSTEEVGSMWENAFFRWMREETDEHTGLLRRECISPMEVEGQWTLLPYLTAYHHVLATYVHARQAHPLPWRLIDTALEVMEYHRGLFCHQLGQRHLPWIFCLTRSLRISPHRHEEVIHTLERFAHRYVDFLQERLAAGQSQDLVFLQNAISGLAELQMTLPGQLASRRPLRQLLDRVAFL